MHKLRTLISAWLLMLLSSPSVAMDYCEWQLSKDSGLPGIEKALCNLQGDRVRGLKVAVDRELGNCLACHVMPIPGEPFHGQIGPPLYGVASRYTPAQLRARLVDATLINPRTIMPAYYRHPRDFHRLAVRFEGQTFLTAQQIEDLLAYLVTLK